MCTTAFIVDLQHSVIIAAMTLTMRGHNLSHKTVEALAAVLIQRL